MGLRRRFPLLWRPTSAQRDGDRRRPVCALVVVALRCEPAQEPVGQLELVQEGSRHFADHCASCHANDGSGNTEVGRNLFPRAPDMRLPATQRLSDGELYDIIQNGVRWTGMPAWGEPGDDPESWKLVLFIRHLPQLSPDELKDMERFNPKSAAEHEEEKREEDFLNGDPAGDATPKKR